MMLILMAGIFSKDYYKILDVPKNITKKRLDKAYKKKLLLLHPDRYSDQKEK